MRKYRFLTAEKKETLDTVTSFQHYASKDKSKGESSLTK